MVIKYNLSNKVYKCEPKHIKEQTELDNLESVDVFFLISMY